MGIVPYIMFNGNCEEALKFYEKALGGEIANLMRAGESPVDTQMQNPQQVMHAHFNKDGNLLFMASDGMGNETGAGMVHLSLNFNDSGSIQNVFNALSDGGKVSMPLQDTFWGATFGMVTDQYGVNWMLNYDKPKG